ncbi:MAG TPA: HXXEE domain-containing protein [Vicinamibacteria bacterium]|nr:HXXEE domain-containing protein [Vicinamibacteria bacterium]
MSGTRLAGLWAVPTALLLHDLEEALTLGPALPRLQAAATRLLARPVALPSEAQYQRALLVLTAAVAALYVLARTWDRLAYALVVMQAVMTLNVGAHVAFAVLLGGYAPGLVTALLVEAPASLYVFRRVHEGAWMSRSQWMLLPLLAAILHGPGLWAGLRGVGVRP